VTVGDDGGSCSLEVVVGDTIGGVDGPPGCVASSSVLPGRDDNVKFDEFGCWLPSELVGLFSDGNFWK